MKQNQLGQVGLVVLLIMTALLSVGISAVNKSTQDLRITREEIESSETLNAAEAGMEQALEILDDFFTGELGSVPTQVVAEANDENISVVLDLVEENNLEMSVGNSTALSLYRDTDEAASWRLHWGLGGGCNDPDIAVVIYDLVSSPTTARRLAFRPNGCADADRTDFQEALADASAYSSVVDVALDANEGLVRLRVLGGDTVVWVENFDVSKNPQLYVLRSTAKRVVGDQTRVVEVRRSLPSFPYVFDYSMFSGSNLVKN